MWPGFQHIAAMLRRPAALEQLKIAHEINNEWAGPRETLYPEIRGGALMLSQRTRENPWEVIALDRGEALELRKFLNTRIDWDN